MQLKTISHTTASLLKSAVFTIKQAHEQIVAAYRAAFVDCCGADFDKTWETWDDFAEVVSSVENQIKEIVLSAGMPKPTWNKYKTACRNVIFFGVPFKFRSVSPPDILRAKKLADQFDDEPNPEKRLTKALRQIRDEKGDQYASAVVAKNGTTILRLPKDDEDSQAYIRSTLERLQHFLDHDKVKNLFKSENVFAALYAQVTTLLQPKKKHKKSA